MQELGKIQTTSAGIPTVGEPAPELPTPRCRIQSEEVLRPMKDSAPVFLTLMSLILVLSIDIKVNIKTIECVVEHKPDQLLKTWISKLTLRIEDFFTYCNVKCENFNFEFQVRMKLIPDQVCVSESCVLTYN